MVNFVPLWPREIVQRWPLTFLFLPQPLPREKLSFFFAVLIDFVRCRCGSDGKVAQARSGSICGLMEICLCVKIWREEKEKVALVRSSARDRLMQILQFL